MTLPVIVIGAGGHAKVLIDALLQSAVRIIGLTDAQPGLFGTTILGVSVIGNDNVVLQHSPQSVRLVNGLGSTKSISARQVLYDRFKSAGYHFASVIHPSAAVSSHANLAEGVQVMAGAVIQAGTRIGENSIVNTRASVDHDCIIGAHVHIAPGATLSGSVELGDAVHVGTGATIIQGVRVGRGSTVAAGAAVISDVPDESKVAGVPAKSLTQ